MISEKKIEFIEFMLSANVLKFGEFKTKSGRLSPYFINTGSYEKGSQISKLGDFYAELVKEAAPDFDAMFGPAYKGIPLAAAAAGAIFRNFGIDKPYFFNRKEEKDHGEGGSLVGYKPKDGDNIIIIEDVITAGTAVRETVPILRAAADVKITDMFISVNRAEIGAEGGKTASEEIYENFGIKVHSIIDVRDILSYLEKKGEADLVAKMKEYMEKYCR